MRIDVVAALQDTDADHTKKERPKYTARAQRKAHTRRKPFIQKTPYQKRSKKTRPMSLERITLIARRIPAVLDKKFNGELEGPHINNIALALKCNGAMKEPDYRRSADREATMLAALNKAVELGLVTIHPTRYGFTCISATSAHTPRPKVIDLSTPSLFRHCTSPYQDEMAHYAA